MSATIEDQRAAVWAEALTWLQTPWQHRQCAKGAGVDCGRLLIACYAAAGVCADFAPERYPADWALNHDREWFLEIIGAHADEIAPDHAHKGDTVVFKYGRTFSHGAIIGEGTQMVHAYRTLASGAVVLGDFGREEEFRVADKRFFSPRTWIKDADVVRR